MFIQRPPCARAKHAWSDLHPADSSTSPPELYLVRSHRWWETAAEPGPVLRRRTGSHEPTSTVSPRTEPCHGDTETLRTLFLSMSSDPLHGFFFCSVTISEPGWASLPGPPPRWAGAPCPAAGGTRRGRRRRRWCAGRPRWTPGRTGPHSCCMWSADGPPAGPPSCAEDPWSLGLNLGCLVWSATVWDPHWTLLKASKCVCLQNRADESPDLYTSPPQRRLRSNPSSQKSASASLMVHISGKTFFWAGCLCNPSILANGVILRVPRIVTSASSPSFRPKSGCSNKSWWDYWLILTSHQHECDYIKTKTFFFIFRATPSFKAMPLRSRPSKWEAMRQKKKDKDTWAHLFVVTGPSACTWPPTFFCFITRLSPLLLNPII